MKIKIDFKEFKQGFIDCGREDYYTEAGKEAIYDYITELTDYNENITYFDPIGITVDFFEYKSLASIELAYRKPLTEIENCAIVIPTSTGGYITLC